MRVNLPASASTLVLLIGRLTLGHPLYFEGRSIGDNDRTFGNFNNSVTLPFAKITLATCHHAGQFEPLTSQMAA